MTDAEAAPPSRKRKWAVVGAIVAAAVALFFIVVGDGVETRGEGIVRAVIAHGHSLTWALLSGSLAAYAIPAAPRRLSSVFGYLAIASYLIFLAAVLLTPQSS